MTPILMLVGSTHVSALIEDRAIEGVEKASQLGWGVVCADEYGVNAMVMQACLERDVPLLVYSIMPFPLFYNGPLEHFEYVACSRPRRDELMCEMADAGLFLWNGHSQEIRYGFRYMSNVLCKPAWLYDYGGMRRARVTLNQAALDFNVHQHLS